MVLKFDELGLKSELLQAIMMMGFDKPTPIQEMAIPPLLEGRNIIGQAQTGTGKTAAFALPMLQSIQPGKGNVQALILTPTRELAVQVTEAVRAMAKQTPLRVLAVYGGQSYQIQTRQLERGVDVVVGTPGRLMDLMRQKILSLKHVHYIVLDEADEMLEMGFIDDVNTILADLPQQRQMALFSATLPYEVRKLAEKYLSDPVEVTIGSSQMTVAETEQRFCFIREDQKTESLVRMLEVENVQSALVFARTKARAQDLADELAAHGFSAEALHGDLDQNRREVVLNRLRQGTISIMVATDIAARGLDILCVSHVFNYDLPHDAEDYVHRIGRTGRAGNKGVAITFLTPRERIRLRQIESYTRQPMRECRVPNYQTVIDRRNQRFLDSLTQQILADDHQSERNLLTGLINMGIAPLDIAAAAVRLLREGEGKPISTEKIEAPREIMPARKSTQQPDTRSFGSDSGRSGARGNRPGKHERGSGMVCLRMNLGNNQGVRPRDVVGAIASETGIPGQAIGDIDIRNDHTFLHVSEHLVHQILQQSTGQYRLRGNPVMLTLAK